MIFWAITLQGKKSNSFGEIDNLFLLKYQSQINL